MSGDWRGVTTFSQPLSFVASLLNAEDVALMSPIAVSPDANLLEALRDFGTRDIDTLPVESRQDGRRQLVGLLLRSDVMRRYREEMLRVHRVTISRH